MKIVLDAREMAVLSAGRYAEHVGLCVLERGAVHGGLEQMPPAWMEEAILGRLEAGFDLHRSAAGPVVRALCRHGGWRLGLAGDPSAALPPLHDMFDALDASRMPEPQRRSP